MSVTLINRLCRRFEEYRCQYHRSRDRKGYGRTPALYDRFAERHHHRDHDRCHRALFLEESAQGEFTLSVSAVGYKSQERKVTLKRGKTLEENFELEEDMVALDGVVVTANRNETARRLAPTLVKVVTPKLFEQTTRILCRKDWSFNPVCG